MKRFLKYCVFLLIALVSHCAIAAWPTNSLPFGRILQFDDYANAAVWTHVGPAPIGIPNQVLKAGTNHFHSSGWKVIAARTGSTQTKGQTRYVPPLNTTNLAANLQNTTDSVIVSPVFRTGIGTVYFEAINNDNACGIAMDIATNMIDTATMLPYPTMLDAETNGIAYVWSTVTNISLSAATATDFVRYFSTFRLRCPAKLQIRRTTADIASGLDAQFAVIDNIRVSQPPADVVVRKAECVFNPGYPFAGSNMTIRCYVDNVDTNAMTDSRTLKAFYRWRYLNQASNAWTNVTMTVAAPGDAYGNNQRFEAQLPVQTQVGDLEYYFTCDFDGYRFQSPDYTLLSYVYPSEWLSPRILRGDTSQPGGREFYARLRPYGSRFGSLQVVTDQHAQPVEMALVGDELWRGLVPLNLTNGVVTNVTWYFKGSSAYVGGSDTFSTNSVYWSEQAQYSVGRVPYGGICVETNATGRMQITVSGGGAYVMMTFNTRTLEYMTSRAEYQNFNAWPAPIDKFTESSGQALKQHFDNSFDTWTTNGYQRFYEAIIGYPTSTNVYWREPVITLGSWVAGSASYVSERTEADVNNRPSGTTGLRNLALRLKGGDGALTLGYVYNKVSTRPDGTKQFSFKTRLGQAGSNFDVAFNRTEFTRTNYLLQANAIMASRSPESPSVSLIGYYRDPGNFYEYRITHIPDTASLPRDKRVNFQLFKWVDGSPSLLKENKLNADVDMINLSQMEMRLYNVSASATWIRCRFAAVGDVLSYTNTVSPIQSGTYGFLSAECRSGFSSVIVQNTDAANNGTGAAVKVLDDTNVTTFNTTLANWYTPAGRFAGLTSVSPYGIYSVIPNQNIGVYLQDSDRDSTTEPSAPGTLAWTKYTEVNVPAFTYSTNTVVLNDWKSKFVMLEVMGGTADVAVDELEVLSWRGQQTPDADHESDYDWLATEAWVTSNTVDVGVGNVVQLESSRADPTVAQGVRSLQMTNGMGMMEFDYKVIRPPAKLTVQYALSRSSTIWTDVQYFVVSNAMSSYVHASSYLGNTNSGFIRVINDRVGGYTNALVEINNAVVWDESAIGDTSWLTYNAKVTDTDQMRVMLDTSKACFLNNSTTQDTDHVQTQFPPFVQAPKLPAGLGDFTMMARAYTNNSPATVYVYASTNGWSAPTNQWFEIYRFSNITNMIYQPYSFKLLNGKTYKAIRVQTQIGEKRACLEEIVLSEPVFPNFDIVNVKPLRNMLGTYNESNFQPMEDENIGIEAQIKNVQLSPSNINMFVSYYVGSNVWGVGNWPSGQKVTLPMYPVPGDPSRYRTSPSNDIPKLERDQVVQYQVTANYLGGVPLTKEQDTFDAPSWYYPVDLNQTYAEQGWSPYFIVYGVPIGAVWINEVNAVDSVIVGGVQQFGIWDNPYIEIAVPAGVDLGGWVVELVSGSSYTPTTIRIPQGLAPQTAVTNGYAFFVIGEHPAFQPSYVPPLPKLDYGYPGFSSVMPAYTPGGIRLRRPLGMYEHTIAYDWDSSYGDYYNGQLWADNDPEHKLLYVGREYNGGSLNVTNGIGAVTNNWCFPLTWTPGGPNVGQAVPSAADVLPGISNVLITAILNNDLATQNGIRSSYFLFKVKKGADTNIHYVVDNWYRLQSVTVNQVEQLPSGQEYADYNLLLPNVQTSLTVSASIGIRNDVTALGLQPNVLAWLLGYPDGPLVPSYFGARQLSLTELYWLNANPTVSNRLEGSIVKVEKTAATNFYVTSSLALNGQNLTNLQGNSTFKIETKSGLSAPDWTMISQYQFTPTSFDVNHKTRTFLTNFWFQVNGVDTKNLYFRWMIEMEDPRVRVFDLINVP